MAVLTLDDLKHRLQELKTLHASGALSAEAYASARAPLERQLVEQVLAQGGPAAAPRAPRKLVAAVAAFVVVVGVGGYLWKGQPQAWDVGPGSATAAADASAADGGSQEMTPQQLAQLTERLAKRLQQEPDNADGWVMLARSYALLSRYGDALAAYQRYTALRPGDAQAWADEADVVAMMQGRSLDGEPARLIAKALSLDPDNFKALALSGSLAFTHGDFPQAVAQWEHAVHVAPNADLANQLQAGIDEARKRGHLAAPSQAGGQTGAAASPGVSGTVTLAAGLSGRVAAGDTVFIFARALNGPPMPLAVLRKQVGDLPLHFDLTDAMAMSPAARLSSAGQVVIVARVSKSGQAMPQPGDLQGTSPPVAVGAHDVDVKIDSVVP